MLACKVQESQESDDGEQIEGYHILVGGGFGPHATLGRELYRDVKAADAPQIVERILKAYVANRTSPQESFLAFAGRYDDAALKAMCDRETVE